MVGENPNPKIFSFIFLIGLLLPFCLPSPFGPIPRWAHSTLPILTGVSLIEAEKAIYAVVVSQLRDYLPSAHHHSSIDVSKRIKRCVTRPHSCVSWCLIYAVDVNLLRCREKENKCNSSGMFDGRVMNRASPIWQKKHSLEAEALGVVRWQFFLFFLSALVCSRNTLLQLLLSFYPAPRSLREVWKRQTDREAHGGVRWRCELWGVRFLFSFFSNLFSNQSSRDLSNGKIY